MDSLTMLWVLVSCVPLVAGHGGILYPPAWQAGEAIPIDEITSYKVYSDPPVNDPKIPWNNITELKSWLTNQAYLGGHGVKYSGQGTATNPECIKAEPWHKRDKCKALKTPWAAPGRTISLGGGCGIYGGNPYGCYVNNDTRPPGTPCGGGTWAFGSSALDIDFPNALTTEWELGSIQDVAWGTSGFHWGGYTYRLCKIPPEGKKGITEECFAQNVLKFSTPYTMMRHMLNTDEDWLKVDQNDLTEGTYPAGSAWRHVAKTTSSGNGYLRKDSVVVPESLPEGDYVLSLRWDTADPQVWSSCANIRLVAPQIIG